MTTPSCLGKPDAVQKLFYELYNEEPLLVRSPGRVNIIGEHTDYNEGFVLPAAIDKAIYLGVTKREDDLVQLFSKEFNETYACRIAELAPTKKGWPNYILGVLAQLTKRGYAVKGVNLVIDGDVPLGAGLSSSAAVECATAFALNELYDLGIDRMTLTRFAQEAEHEFAGVRCGIMDQFASMFGKRDHAIRLDCRSLEFEYVPLDLKDHVFLLFNTNITHSLASSQYNERRQQCEQGVAWIREHHPEVNSLRDAHMKMLNRFVLPKDELVYKRCSYVVEEIQRLLKACEDLKNRDLVSLGQKMFETHSGLSKQYEVSCKELDFLVGYVQNVPGVLGARMMGGGFGGCTINLVRKQAANELIGSIQEAYQKQMGLILSVYQVQIEDGSQCIGQVASLLKGQ